MLESKEGHWAAEIGVTDIMNASHLVDAIFLIVIAFALSFAFLRGIERVKQSRRQRLPKPAVRRYFDWVRTVRNRAIRLPSDSDAYKIDPAPPETVRVDTSIEIKGASFQQFSLDRRVTRAELVEIMPEPNVAWARIGARHRDASLRADDKATDSAS
jgi:hypothetical protein